MKEPREEDEPTVVGKEERKKESPSLLLTSAFVSCRVVLLGCGANWKSWTASGVIYGNDRANSICNIHI